MDGDFLLLHRMQNGDDQAIESFVRKYYPKILRYCHLHIKDSGFAEDLTQETFARFFRTLWEGCKLSVCDCRQSVPGLLQKAGRTADGGTAGASCLPDGVPGFTDGCPYGSGTSSTGTAGSNHPVFFSGSPAKGNCQNFGDQSAAGEVPDQTRKRIIDDLLREGGF